MLKRLKSKQRGVSLVEVLIAIVVFMVGLMALMIGASRTIRTNQEAYVSSQATNVVNSYIGMLRRNQEGVIAGVYNRTITANPTIVASSCLTAACGFSPLADDDSVVLGSMMGQVLPAGAELSSVCTPHQDPAEIAGFTAQFWQRIYSGLCTVTIQWPADRAGTMTTREWRVKV